MAILSKEDMFSDAQAITGTAASENVMDFGASGTWVHATVPITDDKGNSMIPLLIQVTEDFNNLTSLDIELQGDNNAGFGSPTALYSERILLADLVAGKKSAVRQIPNNATEQYMRVSYTVNGTNPSAGRVTAAVAQSESTWGVR